MLFFFFFFNDPAPTEISPLSLHDALPISASGGGPARSRSTRAGLPGTGRSPHRSTPRRAADRVRGGGVRRSEEHTSELQSRSDLVCRLLLEKKKTNT